MPYTSAAVPAPYDGVSQSAPQVRLQSQAEALTDCVVDIPDGWRKRPPMIYQGVALATAAHPNMRWHKLRDPDDGSIKWFSLNRDSGVTTAALVDASLTPVAMTVTAAAHTYLNAITDPKALSRISQVVDYTIVTNRAKVITIDGSTVATRPYEGIVFIKSGAFGKKYQLTVTPTGGSPLVSSVVTPNGNDANDSFWVDTDKIAQGLAGSGYTYVTDGAACTPGAAALAGAGITVTILGPVIYLSHATIDFTVSIVDSQGGVASSVAKGTVNNFSDLPKTCPVNGFVAEILPQRGDKLGAYFVKYVIAPSPGHWIECPAPGSQKGLDVTTMPIGLIKDPISGWILDQLPWKQRTVGDQTLAIDPLFVGDTIQDVGYAFGRLMLVSSEECFLTAADDPFRCYPATMTTAIDSDPISLSPPAGEAQFQSLTTYGADEFEAAFITGLQQQCVLRATGDGAVTVKNAKLRRISKYELVTTNQHARPIANNNKVYLPVPLGTIFAGLREMQLDRISGESHGEDMTAAAPRLLAINLDIAATCEANFTAIYSVSAGQAAVLHVFRYAQSQRVQNGFFRWLVPNGWFIADIHTDTTKIYFFLYDVDGGKCVLFTVEMNPRSLDSDDGYAIASTILTKLDSRLTAAQMTSSTYSAALDQTTIVSPIGLQVSNGYVAAAANSAAQTYPEGYLAEVVSQPNASTIIVKGNWTGPQKFYAGIGYTGYWRPTTIYMVSPQDQKVMHSGKLTLKRLVFDVVNATMLFCKVTVNRRSSRTTALVRQNALGLPTLYTGQCTVKIGGENNHTVIEIMDTSHIGAMVSGFEWFGDYVVKSARQT